MIEENLQNRLPLRRHLMLAFLQLPAQVVHRKCLSHIIISLYKDSLVSNRIIIANFMCGCPLVNIMLPAGDACCSVRRLSHRARDAVHILEAPQLRHDLLHLLRVLHRKPHAHRRSLVAAIWVRIDRGHVDLHLGRNGEQFREHAGLIVADDLELDGIILVEADIPVHLDHAREIRILEDVRTIGAMDGDTAAARDIARDGIAGDGVAALRETHEQAAFSLDEDAVARFLLLAALAHRLLEF